MDFIPQHIEGLYLVKPFHYEDARGSFVKTFHQEEFAVHGLETDFKESFYSESVKGVVRGMHFQVPPHEHAKLVFSMAGEVLDIVLDLRKKSATYGQFAAFYLSEKNKDMLYIPPGMAHGFCSLTDKATLFYFTTSVHHKESDLGIRYDSFGFDWPVDNPIVSERDSAFPPLKEFVSPF
jgi:dTDP-4-dehydrorhamnose 3,5-epimerase